jgi:hypothetical protein
MCVGWGGAVDVGVLGLQWMCGGCSVCVCVVEGGRECVVGSAVDLWEEGAVGVWEMGAVDMCGDRVQWMWGGGQNMCVVGTKCRCICGGCSVGGVCVVYVCVWRGAV